MTMPDTAPAFRSAETRDWPRYFRNVANKPPRETLIEAVERFEQEAAAAGAGNDEIAGDGGTGLAIDLGCGEGRDTAELLRRGWRVLAIDGHELAIELVRHRPDIRSLFADNPKRAAALDARVVQMESIDELPTCQLLNASFSLPFCPPDRFDRLWSVIVESIVPGGRFSGQLFGDRDEWAKLPDRSHQSRSKVLDLLSPFEIESLREEERDGETTEGIVKHWHVFHIVARKHSTTDAAGR